MMVFRGLSSTMICFFIHKTLPLKPQAWKMLCWQSLIFAPPFGKTMASTSGSGFFLILH